MLIWTNFDSFANTYLIISFSNRGSAKFVANTKGPGTSFQVADFVEFFDKFFSFVRLQKLAKFH